MIIDIIDEQEYITQENKQLMEDLIEIAAKKLNLHPDTEVDVTLVSDEEIHRLNKEYRGIDRPTDVLSFALEEIESEFDIPVKFNHLDSNDTLNAVHLGDIILSYPRVVEQAEEYGHSFERELGFLTIHGFLHVNGYDHMTVEEEKVMFGLQDEILDEYGLTR